MRKLSSLILVLILSLGTLFSCTADKPGGSTGSPMKVQASQFITFAIAPNPARGITDHLFVHTLAWINPSSSIEGVRIVRKADSAPSDPNDGTVVFEGMDETFVDESLGEYPPAGKFYYTLFTYNKSGEFSEGFSVKEGAVLHMSLELFEAVYADEVAEALAEEGGTRFLGSVGRWIGRAARAVARAVVSAAKAAADAAKELANTVASLTVGAINGLCSVAGSYADDCSEATLFVVNSSMQAVCNSMGIPAAPYITADGQMGIAIGIPGGPTIVYNPNTGEAGVIAGPGEVWIDTNSGAVSGGVGMGAVGVGFDTSTGTVSFETGDHQVSNTSSGGATGLTVLDPASQAILNAILTSTQASVFTPDSQDNFTFSPTLIPEVGTLGIEILGEAGLKLSWSNPSYMFDGVKLVRKTGSFPTSHTDGNVLYEGTAQSYTDNTVALHTVYYYKLFVRHGTNYSQGRGLSGMLNPAYYTVTFHINDPDAMGSMEPQTIAEGFTDNLSSLGYSKPGWAFLGWAESESGAVAYSNAQPYTMGTQNVNLYARWAENFTITYHKNDPDATGSMGVQTIASGQSANLYLNLFVKENHWFMGWAESETGEVAYANQILYTMGSGNVNLYAKWKKIPGVTWTRATASAGFSARVIFTSVVFDNKIWVIGGNGGDIKFNDVWHTTNGITWTRATASAGFSKRIGHSSVVHDGKIWVIGGQDGSLKNDVWHSSDGINWTRATASAGFTPRYLHSSLVYDNKIWVIGGQDADSYKNDVWCSSDGVNWIQKTNNASFSARINFASVVYDNKIWVIGGGGKNDVWYSSDGEAWSLATNSAQFSGRQSPAAVVFNDGIIVMGGYSNVDGSKNDVWYSANGVNWIQAKTTTVFSPRHGLRSLVFDNKIWAIGGLHINTKYNDVWWSE